MHPNWYEMDSVHPPRGQGGATVLVPRTSWVTLAPRPHVLRLFPLQNQYGTQLALLIIGGATECGGFSSLLWGGFLVGFPLWDFSRWAGGGSSLQGSIIERASSQALGLARGPRKISPAPAPSA